MKPYDPDDPRLVLAAALAYERGVPESEARYRRQPLASREHRGGAADRREEDMFRSFAGSWAYDEIETLREAAARGIPGESPPAREPRSE